jgi:hypothetical protein
MQPAQLQDATGTAMTDIIPSWYQGTGYLGEVKRDTPGLA